MLKNRFLAPPRYLGMWWPDKGVVRWWCAQTTFVPRYAKKRWLLRSVGQILKLSHFSRGPTLPTLPYRLYIPIYLDLVYIDLVDLTSGQFCYLTVIIRQCEMCKYFLFRKYEWEHARCLNIYSISHHWWSVYSFYPMISPSGHSRLYEVKFLFCR